MITEQLPNVHVQTKDCTGLSMKTGNMLLSRRHPAPAVIFLPLPEALMWRGLHRGDLPPARHPSVQLLALIVDSSFVFRWKIRSPPWTDTRGGAGCAGQQGQWVGVDLSPLSSRCQPHMQLENDSNC